MKEPPSEQIVLAIDDYPGTLSILPRIFEGICRVETASSAEDGIEIALNQPVDLILMDISMPGMNGYTACHVLKNDPRTKDIPIIFLTGISGFQNELRGLELGAVDYIVKPYSMNTLVARVKLHLELARNNKTLQQISLTDPLTGLANRRHFDAVLKSEWHNALRYSHVISLVLLDVDNFKAFNDIYGHTTGDDCLQTLGICIRQKQRRAGDLFARYGGEEFAMIFSNTDIAGASLVAQSICESIRDLEIPHSGNPDWNIVTISAGVASFDPSSNISSDIFRERDLLDQADKQLYSAKKKGRNCVVGDKEGILAKLLQ